MYRAHSIRTGLALALLSAASFSTSGSFARSLTGAGWSPAAAVAARISAAAVMLTVPAVVSMRGRWRCLWRNAALISVYGLVAVAGAQLFFFNAIEHLSVGVLPMHASFGAVDFVGRRVSWLVPVLGLSLVAAAIAYVAGIAAARRLGPKLATFVGLTEVVFAVLFAWLLLGELPTGQQLVGGALIVIGIALVRLDELRPTGTALKAPSGESTVSARTPVELIATAAVEEAISLAEP